MKRKIALLTMMMLWVLSGFSQDHSAIIQGSLQSLTDGDSVIVTVNKIGDPFIGENVRYATALKHRAYLVKIPVGKLPLHVSITYMERKGIVRSANKLNRLALFDYYLESGDNVSITEDNGKYVFMGKGSEKFRTVYALNNLQEKYNQGITWGDPSQTALYFQKQDSLLIARMHLLNLMTRNMTTEAHLLIKADILGYYLGRYNFVSSMLPASQIKVAIKDLRNYYSIVPKRYLFIKPADSRNSIKLSSAYTLGLLTKYKFDSCSVAGKPYKLASSVSYFNHAYSNALRERLVINAIYLDKDSNEDLRSYVNQALDWTTVPEFRSVLINLKRTRLAGALAFNFNLPDTAGKMRALSEFKGKIILLDFWFTGCGSCKLSAPFLKKVEEQFSGKPVVFITVSFDKARNLWLESVRSRTYTSEHTLDLFSNGKGFNHPIIDRYSIDGCPTFILIDKNGRLMINPENPRFDNGASLTSIINSELINFKRD